MNFLFSGKIENIFRMDKTARAKFGTKLGITAAAAGSAVGREHLAFPELDGAGRRRDIRVRVSGVRAFFGVPIVFAEFILGRAGKANSARAYRNLAPGGWFHVFGYFSISVAFFFCMVVAD